MSHYCPRRDDQARAFAGAPTFYPDPEAHIGTTPLEDEWREDGTCSYCGSISPAMFIAYIRAGGEVGPTDKGYKAYLTDAPLLATLGAKPHGAEKFYLQHIAHPGPDRAALYDLVQAGSVRYGYPGHWYARGMLGMRHEHLLRHPDEMSEAERTALAALHERAPEVVAP